VETVWTWSFCGSFSDPLGVWSLALAVPVKEKDQIAGKVISLDILPPDKAAEMLAGMIGVARAGAAPEAVARAAGLYGRLPLTLRIAGQARCGHGLRRSCREQLLRPSAAVTCSNRIDLMRPRLTNTDPLTCLDDLH
jgi:hypothetical protein